MLKIHAHAGPGVTNLYGEKMTLCGLTGYETRATTLNDRGGYNTERRQITALQFTPGDLTAINCKRCLHLMGRRLCRNQP